MNTTNLKIEGTDIILQDLEKGQGKIIIANTYGFNFSYFWGAMGSSLSEFILGIDSVYFCKNLLPPSDRGVLDAKGTFKNIRDHIKNEMYLPWYNEMEFQKSMRESLKEFQNECTETQSEHFFVESWDRFINNLDYYLLDDSNVEDSFKGICEHWHFIEKGPSEGEIFLQKLFPKLQKEIKKTLKSEKK